MDDNVLAGCFQEERTRLRGLAYRMLGSSAEADDALQESWIRISRAGTGGVSNIGGWLTTVVARVCLDMLRSRKSRKEEFVFEDPREQSQTAESEANPEQEAVLADSLGVALLVVLETLSPVERVAFVLHDMFDVPFTEIASIVGRTPDAARQLASRARRRVQGASPDASAATQRRSDIVRAFLDASRSGNLERLVLLLHPHAILRADDAAAAMGADARVEGAAAIAQTFSGRARGAEFSFVNGEPALVWATKGTPRVVFLFDIDGDRIAAVDLIADHARIAALNVR